MLQNVRQFEMHHCLNAVVYLQGFECVTTLLAFRNALLHLAPLDASE